MIKQAFKLLFLALAVLALSGPAVAAALEGTWSGGGHVKPTSGTREKLRCKITYRKRSSKVFSVRAVCATASVKINQTGEVLMVTPNRYVGDFYNPEFDVSGRVRVILRGSRQTVTFSGARGRGTVTLSKR